jgi:hypothetical protein
MMDQEKPQRITVTLLSLLAGLVAAWNLGINFYRSNLQTSIDWIVLFSLLTFAFGVIFSLVIPYIWKQYQAASPLVRIWVLILALISALFFTLNSSVFIIALIFNFLVCLIFAMPGFSAFQRLLEQGHIRRFLSAWALGVFFAFWGVSFLQNFYPTSRDLILLSISVTILATLAWDIILEYASISIKEVWREKLISLGVLVVAVAFILLAGRLLFANQQMFSFNFFLPTPQLITVFLGLAILSQSWSAFLLNRLDQFNWRNSRFIAWIRRNIPGLLLAIGITFTTFALALPFVSTDLGRVDNYFDTDSVDWINRLSSSLDNLLELRSVHPSALLILRPPTWLLSLLLNGDKIHAAILLNALAGGVCIYLTWRFFKRRTRNTSYALLIAALLGLSNSHLILSTFLETYIFSAAALIAFLFLLESEEYSLKQLVPTAVLVFGITITNFVQTCILFLMNPRRRRKIIIFAAAVLVISILAAFVQNLLYPSNRPFFIPSNLMGESAYRFNPFHEQPKLVVSRLNLLLRHIALFDVVAPRPLILTHEVGCVFPCLQTYYKRQGAYVISSYVGFGSWLARIWFVGLVLAGGIYLWRLFKSQEKPYLQTALLLTILFNFILHMFYGDDPMLYSPDWTYAVVFFFGISYENLASKKWFQSLLLVFLACLLINNLDLFRKILEAVAAYMK